MIRKHIERLSSREVGVRQEAAAALMRLAYRNDENQVLIAREGGIGPLVGLLGDQDTEVRRNAAGALWNVAVNAENKVLIAREGGIGPLVRLLGDQETEVRRYAAGALLNVAVNAENKVLIAREGGIGPLVRLLGDQDTGVRKQAAGALERLSQNAQNKVLIAREGGIGPLVRLLGDQDTQVRQRAAGALMSVANNAENQVLIAREGGIGPLVRLLGDQDTEVRQQAAGALWVVAENAENKVLIAREGGIGPLVRLLGDQDTGVRQTAAGALLNVAANVENKVLIAREGGIGPLVRLLGDQDTIVRLYAAGALWNVARNAENQVLIAREGGIGRLVLLLPEDNVHIRRCAVKVLKELVNVSLWYDEAIKVAFETQKQRESQPEIKEDLQYILDHWQKKPVVALNQDMALSGASVSSKTSSEHPSSRSESSGQSTASGMGAPIIQASEVRLGRRLGRGAFGEVYEAIYQYQKVAVKKYFGAQLCLSERTKIAGEVALMVRLKHKYLVAFLGVIEEPSEMPSLVMECGEKGALYDYLRAHSDIAWSWRLRVADELARGLAYLHEKNVVHRDIKSLNVVLDEDLHAKWCDFGLAVLKQHATATNTRADQTAGTARWMAPELFEDEPVVSRKGDIWSYGMVLFELATQTIPYQSLNERQVIGRLMKHKAEEVPEVCKARVPKFASLMEACWKQYEERPEASRLVEILAEAREAYGREGEPQSLSATSDTLVSGFIGLSMNI